MKTQFNYISLLYSCFILFFTYIMLTIVLPYTTWEWNVDFLQTKQHIIHLDYYRLAFYVHIFSSVFILFAGATQFSTFFLKKWKKVHRYIGKTYIGLLLLVSAPGAMVMAFYANGGLLTKVSFLILAPLWWWFTWKGYQTARQQDWQQHRAYMVRSYALTLSAVTLRVMQLFLGSFFLLEAEFQYTMVSWLSWTVNLAVAEWWLRRTANKKGLHINAKP